MSEGSPDPVAVLGAGAVGCVVGARLAKAGVDVTLVARAAHAKTLREKGLTLTTGGASAVHPIRVADRLDFAPGLLILAVKTQDLRSACEDAKPWAGDATVVTLQNGLRAEEIAAEALGAERIVGGVVLFDAVFLEPGQVTLNRDGMLLVGSPTGNTAEARRVAGLLSRGIATRVVANLRACRWTKLLVNLNNAIPAATGLPVQAAYAEPGVPALAVRMMREGLAVAGAAREAVASIPWASVPLIRALWLLPVGIASRILVRKARRLLRDVPALGSTLQSIRRGRLTEIDYLNGEIVGLGWKLGVPTPVNAALVAAVHEVEATGRFLSPAELLRRAPAHE